ncbi:MAG: hypothetical protein OEV85_09705 [Candidatus Thorarchaeota archaeon]|nr:hypothetical protein [Candidatus Thorarchaeota archaeon]
MVGQTDKKRKKLRIKTKLSKIQFPEICPVCVNEAEDIVFVTVIERIGPESYDSSSMIKGSDRASVSLEAARGATTFPVPTCLRHGSKSVRSLRTKLFAVVGFFVFFYPILFFLLQINAAFIYSRPIIEPIAGFIFFTLLLILSLLYGLFPRALERSLRFENISRTKDSVEVVMTNSDYGKRFLNLNEMFSDSIKEDNT